MALKENKYEHLVELSSSDYEIVDGEPDIKGWTVKNVLGQKLGEVDELLFDPVSRQVRYIVVDLSSNQLGLEEDKRILVPIGVAELYEDGKLQDEGASSSMNQIELYYPYNDGNVIIVTAAVVKLRELPAYRSGDVSIETEATIRRVFEGSALADQNTGGPIYTRDDFYTHEHFNADKFYNKNKLAINKDQSVERSDPGKQAL